MNGLRQTSLFNRAGHKNETQGTARITIRVLSVADPGIAQVKQRHRLRTRWQFEATPYFWAAWVPMYGPESVARTPTRT